MRKTKLTSILLMGMLAAGSTAGLNSTNIPQAVYAEEDISEEDLIYEEPKVETRSQQIKEEVDLCEVQLGKLDIPEGTKLRIYYREKTEDNSAEWQKSILLKDKEVITKTVSTEEYNKREWVSNYANLSPENQVKYKEYAKEDTLKEEDEISTEDLQKELAEKLNALKDIEWEYKVVLEDLPKGYELTSKKKEWACTDNEGILEVPDIAVEAKRITDTVKATDKYTASSTLNLNITVKDAVSGSKISGGKYTVKVDGKTVAENTTFKNGVLKGNWKISAEEAVDVSSGDVEYYLYPVEDANADSTELTKKDAEKKAKSLLTAKKKEIQKDFEATERKVEIIEEQAPSGYAQGTGNLTFTTNELKITKTLEINGTETLTVRLTDSKGNKVEGGTITVTDKDGVFVYGEGTSGDTIKGLKANTNYRINVVEVPEGYVTPKITYVDVCTSTSGKKNAETFSLTQNKIYHQLQGITMTVVDELGNVVDEWVTDDNTHAVKHLTEGVTYTLTESNVPEGYSINPDLTFLVANKNNEYTAHSVMTKLTGDAGTYAVLDVDTGVAIDTFELTEDNATSLVDNLIFGHKYTLQQIETPEGYVSPADALIDVQEDQTINMSNSRFKVSFDTDVEGKTYEVLNSDGDSVYDWVCTGEDIYLSHVQAGKTYTIHDTSKNTGYTLTADAEIQPEEDKEDSVTLSSSIYRVEVEDEDAEVVSNTRMAIKDAEGNVVDEWITGEHILDISTEEQNTLVETGSLVKTDGLTRDISNGGNANYLDKAVELALTTIYPAEEVTTYSSNTYLQMAYETLPYDSETLTNLVTEAESKIEAARGTLDKKTGEDLKAELRADFEASREELQAKIDKALAEIDEVKIEKIADSTGYELQMRNSDGTYTYYDINEFGNETSHRVKGVMEDGTYLVTELVTAGEYNSGDTVETVINGKVKSSLKLNLSHKIPAEVEEGKDYTPLIFVTSLFALGMGIVAFTLHQNKKLKLLFK